MAIFTTGIEYRSRADKIADAWAGGADEAEQIRAAERVRVTDAVRAAARAMNRLDETPTSVMGNIFAEMSKRGRAVAGDLAENVVATDVIMKSICRQAQQSQGRVNAATMIRLGLFANKWCRWKRNLALLAFAAQISVEETQALRAEAEVLARQVEAQIPGRLPFSGTPLQDFSWSKLLAVVGAIVAVVLGYRVVQIVRRD